MLLRKETINNFFLKVLLKHALRDYKEHNI